MEVQKVARQLDELGRIVIPADIRETLGWETGTKLVIEINDIAVKSIVVRESVPGCSLCRSQSENLIKIEKGYICGQCAEKVR